MVIQLLDILTHCNYKYFFNKRIFMKNNSDYIASPCIGVCMLQKINNVTSCTGCKRTPYEIRNWTILTNEQREDIITELKSR